ncbi:hypothetical protein Plim_2154 [Planctopirus limnophila DSM 3776]|uniref:Uncharacterized protein n=2 Tax=Planctopirus TaxID=1649480 RepID=D5SMS6_PLAL2|nr:hypothetical protein Plim_2154 [Planctopirus limnophila DSM 3776]QDV30995.1 hypothetical protein Spb1_29320 [Planctopirus ephydatiae]
MTCTYDFQACSLLTDESQRNWGQRGCLTSATQSVTFGLPAILTIACGMGVVIAAMEAWSPLGLDNLTIPLVTGPCIDFILL